MRFNPKPKNRWKWPLLIGIPVVILGIVGFATNTNPPTNIAQTSPNETPELRTRIYSQSVEKVMETANQVAYDQKTWFRSWRVFKGDGGSIEAEIPVLFFTDDLSVRFDTDEKGRTRVNVESKSRVGQGDFGENRRHIAQFLRALDKELGENLN